MAHPSMWVRPASGENSSNLSAAVSVAYDLALHCLQRRPAPEAAAAAGMCVTAAAAPDAPTRAAQHRPNPSQLFCLVTCTIVSQICSNVMVSPTALAHLSGRPRCRSGPAEDKLWPRWRAVLTAHALPGAEATCCCEIVFLDGLRKRVRGGCPATVHPEGTILQFPDK